ncbi:MAG TPA: zf-HC2 domain-containing protein [Actinomycetota bacterium]|nr:zf-HC2 domain-containing protein [Actinomycetota bacterium]
MEHATEHEYVSASLGSFVDGTLSDEDALRVRSHLADCTSCASELAALHELRGLTGGELSELESRRLLAAVRNATRDSIAMPASVPAAVRPSPGRSRFAQALGAVALLALATVGAYMTFAGNTDGSSQGAAEDAAGGAGQGDAVAEIRSGLEYAAAPVGGALEPADSEPEQLEPLTEDAGDTGATGATGGEAGTGIGRDSGGSGAGEGAAKTGGDERRDRDFYSQDPRPFYVRRPGRISDSTLVRIGSYGLPLVDFTRFTAADAFDRQVAHLSQLANAAESPERAEQIADCGTAVLARPEPILPALATFGRYRGRTTLVLAFAWTDSEDGPLDRFMVWTWNEGSCDEVPGYHAGFIQR